MFEQGRIEKREVSEQGKGVEKVRKERCLSKGG